jgi:Transmembrane secretion effector
MVRRLADCTNVSLRTWRPTAGLQRPGMYLVVTALAGMGWTLSASELWVASQRAMPDWARGRMNATMVMVSQGGDRSWWGDLGVHSASRWSRSHFSGVCLVRLIGYGCRPCCSSPQNLDRLYQKPEFRDGSAYGLSQHIDPGRLPAPKDGPLSITAEFQIEPTRRSEFIKATGSARLIFLRNGAYRWHLFEELNEPNKFRMEVTVHSWKQHLII